MVFTFPEIKLGKPVMPTRWSNSEQKNVEVDPKQIFIETIQKSSHNFVEGNRAAYDRYTTLYKTIKFEADSLESDTIFFHRNFMDYLEKCWGSHLGIIITPDIIWYTILSEMTTIIKSNAESFRHIFTTSSEKKTIIVESNSTTMPLDELVYLLLKEIPTDTLAFFPEFEFTKNSKLAFQAAFSDMCSPYYDYSMLCCGFPFIKVKGSIDDWKLLNEHWINLKSILKSASMIINIDKVVEWETKITHILSLILSNFNNTAFWQSIFSVKKCGSGHQTVVSGWFADFFVVTPLVKYAENYSSHISNIKYNVIGTNKHFEMNVGLFNSVQTDEFMEPSFSSITYNMTEFVELSKKV